MEAAGCLPAPSYKARRIRRGAAPIVAVFKPNPEYLKPAGYCLEAPPRVLRVLPPTNAGYFPDGGETGELTLAELEDLACNPRR